MIQLHLLLTVFTDRSKVKELATTTYSDVMNTRVVMHDHWVYQ
jgi:hypothetical protein